MALCDFNQKWSSNLAYVIGLLSADGNLSKDGRHIIFVSKDYEQIMNFLHVLKLRIKIGLKSSGYSSKKKYFYVQFSDVKLYKFLLSIGLIPNKSKKLASLKIPDKYFADYLRGYLDGDGYTYSYWDKRWRSSFMFYTGFVSGSKKHLIWIKNNVKKLYGVSGTIICNLNGRSTYYLSYAKNSSLILLEKMYYDSNVICLKRKRFKIEAALDIIRYSKPRCWNWQTGSVEVAVS